MDTTTPRKRFIRLPEVIDRVGLKRTRIYDLMDSGDFPKCVKLGPPPKDLPRGLPCHDCRREAWLEHEIDEWMQSRIEQRDQGDVGR